MWICTQAFHVPKRGNAETEYEDARDLCDPPLAFDASNDDQPTDLLAIIRVRIKITIETDRPDPFNPDAGPNQVTLVSEATIRNRL